MYLAIGRLAEIWTSAVHWRGERGRQQASGSRGVLELVRRCRLSASSVAGRQADEGVVEALVFQQHGFELASFDDLDAAVAGSEVSACLADPGCGDQDTFSG